MRFTWSLPWFVADYSHPMRDSSGYEYYNTVTVQPDHAKVMALALAAGLFTLTGILLASKAKAALPLAWVSFGYSVILAGWRRPPSLGGLRFPAGTCRSCRLASVGL